MAGLVPAIHVLLAVIPKDVDARHKAGHDESECDEALQSSLAPERAITSAHFFESLAMSAA
jgi:hypothetical protein